MINRKQKVYKATYKDEDGFLIEESLIVDNNKPNDIYILNRVEEVLNWYNKSIDGETEYNFNSIEELIEILKNYYLHSNNVQNIFNTSTQELLIYNHKAFITKILIIDEYFKLFITINQKARPNYEIYNCNIKLLSNNSFKDYINKTNIFENINLT